MEKMNVSKRFTNGMIAGFVGSLILALIIVIKTKMQWQMGYDSLGINSNIAGYHPDDITTAWILHFLIGTFIWGIFYGLIHNQLGYDPLSKGFAFSIISWLIAMILLIPLAGQGPFFIKTDDYLIALLSSYMMQLVFSIVTAVTYSSVTQAGHANRIE